MDVISSIIVQMYNKISIQYGSFFDNYQKTTGDVWKLVDFEQKNQDSGCFLVIIKKLGGLHPFVMELAESLLCYAPLSRECIAEIERRCTLVYLKSGEEILRQDDVCDNFYINRTAIMRVSHTTDNKEHTILFGTDGDIYTSLHSWVAGEPSPFSLTAVGEAEVWELSYTSMRHLLARYPEMTNWLLQLSLAQLYGLERRYLGFCSNNTEERLRNFLDKVDPKFKRMPGKKMMRHIPLKYIASYLGVAQATLSRLRAKILRDTRSNQ